MDILIRFCEKWGDFWGAFPLFTLVAIYLFFRVIFILQGVKHARLRNLSRKH